MSKTLVIVESPTKAKTIQGILGKDVKTIPSMGHIIDLPQKQIGIEVEDNFKPTYTVLKGRAKVLQQIKKAAKDADKIYLATDPDREGEAIGWHLKEKLKLKKKYFRVILHEITKPSIKEAFAHPEELDLNKVKAQQTRRILDRLVGYFLSPFLWRKVARGLSAGRVQSVALRLIVERERKITEFKPKEYWQIEAQLNKKKGKGKFIAKLNKINGANYELQNETETKKVTDDIKNKDFKVVKVVLKQKKRYASAPFITSTLQQEAFNKLRFIAKRTMMVAQQLYEGIELPKDGSVGLITYMRTDSTRVYQPFIDHARNFIAEKFGKEYLPEKANYFKVRKTAQQAHEAIRPTSLEKTPDSIKEFLTHDQFRLYQLIYNRFLASQMNPARFNATSVVINVGIYEFSASGQILLFDGFLKLYNIEDDEKQDNNKNKLPVLSENELLDLEKLLPQQSFTKPPARFSESSLIKILEELGVGRPSTYAPIIQTLVIRSYVHRLRGYFEATELGMTVSDILVDNFPKVMDVKFTAGLEEELDQIEEGKIDYLKVLNDFYTPFKENLDYAKKHVKKEVITADENCPQCGSVLVYKWGRRGRFLSCSKFPTCKFSKSITTGVKCPSEDCDGELIQRHSKRGVFYGCSKFPKCRYITDKLPQSE
ncbi:MAG: type I DNA topoisomerase [Candidatus Gygaella obscura]|nr:type I DNA topoisomerase [Candidatus Gygaella obscura]